MTTAPNPWPRKGVHKLPAGAGWMVPSESVPGAFRHVTFEQGYRRSIGFHCTCPAGKERGLMSPGHACRHVRLVAEAESDDGYPPRPSAPTNVSALVD